MTEMPTVIGYTSSIVYAFKIDTSELVIMPFSEAANPVLADWPVGELLNEVLDHCRRWR